MGFFFFVWGCGWVLASSAAVGHWVPGIGFRALAAGYWVPGIGFRALGSGHWDPGIGNQVLNAWHGVSLVRSGIKCFALLKKTPFFMKNQEFSFDFSKRNRFFFR